VGRDFAASIGGFDHGSALFRRVRPSRGRADVNAPCYPPHDDAPDTRYPVDLGARSARSSVRRRRRSHSTTGMHFSMTSLTIGTAPVAHGAQQCWRPLNYSRHQRSMTVALSDRAPAVSGVLRDHRSRAGRFVLCEMPAQLQSPKSISGQPRNAVSTTIATAPRP